MNLKSEEEYSLQYERYADSTPLSMRRKIALSRMPNREFPGPVARLDGALQGQRYANDRLGRAVNANEQFCTDVL